MAYADLATIQATNPGSVLSAAWCDQARDNDEFHIDPPACAVFHSTTTNVTTSTTSVLPANSEIFDNDAMHSTVTNNSRITIQTPGRYLYAATTEFASNATGTRQIELLVNGTADLPSVSRGNAPSGLNAFQRTLGFLVLSAGTYLEIRAFQNSGSTLAVRMHSFSVLFLTR